MQNPVYRLVSEALARVVSERAADRLLLGALEHARLSPESVGAADMQRVLDGPLQARLETFLPPARARQELRELAARLHMLDAEAPTLFEAPRVGGGVNQMPQAPAAGVAVMTAPRAASANPVDAGAADFDSDDFEYDDPGAPAREYDLSGSAGQDDLIGSLARFGGVQGVLLCDEGGAIVRARLVGRRADSLAPALVAAARALKARPWRILCADLGAQTVCVRPLGRHFVALLAGNAANLGQLIAELNSLRETT